MHPGQTMQPEVNLGRSYEPFFVCRKGQPVLQKRGRSNVFSFPPVSAQKKIHKTEKPADLMSEIYATFCAKHDKVLVPFLGSGVDIMVGLRYDYDVRGYDLGEEIKKRFMVRVGEEFKK
jgi:DNA modification methylase